MKPPADVIEVSQMVSAGFGSGAAFRAGPVAWAASEGTSDSDILEHFCDGLLPRPPPPESSYRPAFPGRGAADRVGRRAADPRAPDDASKSLPRR